MSDPILFYTDGAVHNNGRATAGGIAFYAPGIPYRKAYKITGASVTNNICELMAIEYTIIYAIHHRLRSIEIATDSVYAMKCLTVWYPAWLKSGWLNSKKKPVENQDIIKRILAMQEVIEVKYRHVSAHRREPLDKKSERWMNWHGNDVVDKLATLAVSSADIDTLII